MRIRDFDAGSLLIARVYGNSPELSPLFINFTWFPANKLFIQRPQLSNDLRSMSNLCGCAISPFASALFHYKSQLANTYVDYLSCSAVFVLIATGRISCPFNVRSELVVSQTTLPKVFQLSCDKIQCHSTHICFRTVFEHHFKTLS